VIFYREVVSGLISFAEKDLFEDESLLGCRAV
jgi:hypothetical protein